MSVSAKTFHVSVQSLAYIVFFKVLDLIINYNSVTAQYIECYNTLHLDG